MRFGFVGNRKIGNLLKFKTMPNYESLLERIKQSPYEHLGRRSVSEIGIYIIGYDLARQFWGLPNIPYSISRERYKEWVDSKVHLCRQNLETFCLLLTEDERQAFDLFFELHNSALEECKDDLILQDLESKKLNQSTATKSRTLVDFILDEEGIKKRPAIPCVQLKNKCSKKLNPVK